jgi:hypothetical protein
LSGPAKGGARLRIHRVMEAPLGLSRQARAIGPEREALS